MNRRSMGVFFSVVVAVLLIISGTVSAQIKITGGLKGGLNIMMPYGDDLSFLHTVRQYTLADGFEGEDPFEIEVPGTGGSYPIDISDSTSVELGGLGTKMGFMMGGFVSIQVNEYFAIQPEIMYVRKGGKQDLTVNTTALGIPIPISGEVAWKLDYIEIPLLAKIILPTESKISPSFLVGPAIAFKVSSKLAPELAGIGVDIDIDPIIKSTDFGLIVGGGLDIDLSEKAIFNLEGRFGLGLTNFFDLPIDIISVKNSNISFTAGFAYRFGS